MENAGELAALATAGATVLIGAMVSDAWNGVRPRFARLFGRGDSGQDAAQLARLDRDHTHLQSLPLAARDEQGAALAAQWTVRLLDLVEAEPDVAVALRELIAWWRGEYPEPARAEGIRQQAKASGHARITQVGGNQVTLRPGQS